MSCKEAISSSEYYALQSLYNSTNGDKWCWDYDLGVSTQWNFTTFDPSLPCIDDWQGIKCHCSRRMAYVYKLDLAEKCLVGRIPNNIGELSNMLYLIITNNVYLTGTIPESISSMTALQELALKINSLTSTIPSSIFKLTTLQLLNFQDNFLTGSLPSSVSNLVNMTTFAISQNLMTGSVPPDLWNLEYLTQFYCSANYMDGQLNINTSNKFNYSLNDLQMYLNNFSGSIPTSFCNYKSFRVIKMYQNLFTSTIPSCMENFLYLNSVSMEYNYFSGSFPSKICSSQNLTVLVIAHNYFTGEICFNYLRNVSINPIVLVSNSHIDVDDDFDTVNYEYGQNLQIIYFDNNYFTGIISTEICKFMYLSSVNLFYNKFSGSLPGNFGSCLPYLHDLLIYHNYFSGTVPEDLYLLDQLREFLIQDNLFTGNIQKRFNYSSQIYFSVIDMSNNILTSSIPSELFMLPQLQSIVLSTNCFTGSLPSTICQPNRTLISVLFDGLSSGFNCPSKYSNNLKFFESISLLFNGRGVYGTIPSCLFSMPLLSTLHLSGYKYSFLFIFLPFNHKLLGNLISGTLPNIYSYQSDDKTQLNLLYNTNPSNLSDLSLSNNRLHGTIPLSFQKYNFSQLLLSNNELSGTLSRDYLLPKTQTALSLSVNRLSGNLPDSFQQSDISHISLNILSGNLFQCHQNSLPSNDPDAKAYSCGSNDLNTAVISFFILFSFISMILITIIILYKKQSKYLNSSIIKIMEEMSEWIDAISINDNRQEIKRNTIIVNPMYNSSVDNISKIVRSHSDSKSSDSPKINNRTMNNSTNNSVIQTRNKFYYLSLYPQTLLFIDSLRWIQLVTFCIVLFLLIILLPINLSLASRNSIYTYQYGWVISMVLQHGISTAIVYIVSIFLILLIVKLLMFGQKLSNTKWLNQFKNLTNSPIETVDKDSACSKKKVLAFTLLIMLVLLLQSINAVVTLSVNIAYVQDALRSSQLTSFQILCLQVSIGIFKVTWGMTYIPLSYYILIKMGYSSLFSIQNRLFMALVNFVFAPVIATLISNESCFYYAFNNETNITSTFYIPLCPQLLDATISSNKYVCLNYLVSAFTTSFTPSFVYSYNCGSALLTAYIPVILYSYISIGLLLPLLRYPIMKVKFLLYNYFNLDQLQDFQYTYINGIAANVTLMQHFTVLLTFGISYPLLGLVIGLAIYIESYYYQLVIGYCIKMNYLSYINKYIDKSWGAINSCSRLIVCTVCFYWSFLFFDMIGDKYGAKIGSLVVLGFILFIIFITLIIISIIVYKIPIVKDWIILYYERIMRNQLILIVIMKESSNDNDVQLVSIESSSRLNSQSFGVEGNITLDLIK